jgi:aryl-alcohol dehydrogenase-like predicted oxidoreductase
VEYRNFGRTGVKVSQFALGCMNFGGRTEEEESLAIIERALEWGINLLDTANVYSQGRSEEIVGKALKQSGRRDRIIVATKVHGRTDHKDPNAQGNHRRHIIAECEKSLRRLGTDTIDLYQIHRPCADIPIDETLRALDDLIRSGKVRYVGTSTFASWQIIESLWVSKELGLNRFVSRTAAVSSSRPEGGARAAADGHHLRDGRDAVVTAGRWHPERQVPARRVTAGGRAFPAQEGRGRQLQRSGHGGCGCHLHDGRR